MTRQSIIKEELASSIVRARREVTILFTDIVDSSRYWDQFGDVQGRMMVDRHNRLVFPVVRKFRGRVVKTIGDGLMAVFRRPNDALNAAIGVQQILNKMRDADRSFHAKVRIGIHTGIAIVEQNDVFGDAVNVAKRVEDFGEANEICLSEATAERLAAKRHTFHKKGSFIPKGKREPMTVHRCRWNEYKDLARGLKVSSDFPLDAREKGDIAAYGVIALLVFGVLYLTYLRYWWVDTAGRELAFETKLLILNPLLIPTEYPPAVGLAAAVLMALVLLLIRIRTAPYLVLRLLKGVAGFGLGFMLLYTPALWFGWDFATGSGQQIAETGQRFVRADYARVQPLLDGLPEHRNFQAFFDRPLLVPVSGDSALDAALKRKAARGEPGRGRPPAGVWSAANLSPYPPQPFVFRLLDLCALCLGVMGFVSGYMNFALNPR